MNKWQREFYTDSHRLWPTTPAPAQMRGKQWENLGRQTELSMEENGQRAGRTPPPRLCRPRCRPAPPPRLRDFLRFAVWHEEPRLDPDEFDLGYYCYGLRTVRQPALD